MDHVNQHSDTHGDQNCAHEDGIADVFEGFSTHQTEIIAAELPCSKRHDDDAAGHEHEADRAIMDTVVGRNLQKQIKLRHHKAKSHQRYTCAQPGQEGAFIRQHLARIRFGSNDIVSFLAQPVPSLLMQGSFHAQVRLLHRLGMHGFFQLVYADPPFYSGKVQRAEFGEFNDRWATLTDYLQFMEDYIREIPALLSPTGFFVLHCDPHASHYLKVLGDKIFGYENFRNEIIWHYTGRRTPAVQRVNSKHDVLLVWAAGGGARMTGLVDPWTRDYYVQMKRQAVYTDEDGREWLWGHRGKGQSHAYRLYIDTAVEQGRPIDSVWDIPIINTSARERTGYPTQKPLALLRRVVSLLSREGDWVADLMAGSGTVGEAALGLGRPVFLGDANPSAVKIMRQRIMRLK